MRLRGKSIGRNGPIFYEFENVRAIRTTDWKYIERFPDGPNELYDLAHDPHEQQNLVDQPAESEMQAKLRNELHAFFDKYADPKYDLSREGKSKSLLLSRPKPKQGLPRQLVNGVCEIRWTRLCAPASPADMRRKK